LTNVNPAKEGDIESAPSRICPVTGLPVLRKPEWTDVSFGTNYRATLIVLGGSILFGQASGYVTLHDMKNALELISKVVDEAVVGGRPFVHIEDLSNVHGTPLEARRYFIDNMKKRERLQGLIFCGASPMLKLSIKLGKRLNITKANIEIVDDYSEAVKLALKMLATGRTSEDKPIIASTEKDKICPVTGLPITSKPEWTDVSLDTDTGYKATLSILGDSILLSQASGYGTLSGVKKGLKLASKVVTSAIDGGRPYVQIEEYSDLLGATIETRKHYIDVMKKRERLLGLIYCGTSPMLNLMIKLAKRLNVVKFDVQIANDYSEAVALALKILATGKIQPHDPLANVTPQPLIASEKGYETCPVTGLPITSRPEWTDIALGEGYSVTFKFIGDRILLSIPRGGSGKHGMENLMRERARVLGFVLGPDGPFCELKDYSKIQESISRAGRDQFTRGMTADKDRIMGFIGYNAPLTVRLVLNVGKKLYKAPFPMSIVTDYETAVKEAVEILKRHGYGKGGLAPEIITRPDWVVQLDGFSARFEVIDGDILHAINTGFYEKEHIDPAFRLQEKAINSMDQPKGSYYLLVGVTEVEGISRKARQLYIGRIKEWYKAHPFQMYIFYGANRFLRTAINIASPLVPFKVRLVKDLDSALKLIAEEKAACASKDKSIKSASRPTVRGAVREPLPSGQIQQYVDELLQYLGSINWETDGTVDSMEVDPAHPFAPIFDAIALVKNDLDDLFQERKQAQSQRDATLEALRESEGKYRSLVVNIPDVTWTTDREGKTAFISPNVERVYGYTQEEIYEGGDHRWFGRIHPDDVEIVKQTYQALFEKGMQFDIEYRIKRKDGEWLWLHDRAVATYAKDGMLYADGVFSDITERKRTEEALRIRDWAMRSSLSAIVLADLQGDLIYVNPAFLWMWGYEDEKEVLGKSIASFWQVEEQAWDVVESLRDEGGG